MPFPSPTAAVPPLAAVPSIAMLRRRHSLLRRLRRFFDRQGFVEVTTPLLASEVIVDRYITPFRVPVASDGISTNTAPTYYLQTSPELHMKRLLAAGARAIYQVNQAFRASEVGTLHNPEFTMVEWYRVHDEMHSGIALLAELIVEMLDCPFPSIQSYQQVFQHYAGFDPLAIDNCELASRAGGLEGEIHSFDRDDLLNLAFSNLVQPQLTTPSPTIVHGFPASQAALARLNRLDPRVADRFELYYRGVELANGYDELTDPVELGKRQLLAIEQRAAAQLPVLPFPHRLLAAAKAGLPPCTGVALGFDRLVMVATNSERLAEVTPFTWSSA